MTTILSACDGSASPDSEIGTGNPDTLDSSEPANGVEESRPAGEASVGSGTSTCTPSQAEEEMLRQINIARSQSRHCGPDHYEAAGPLAWDCKLQKAAYSHSEDMATINFFSHTGSDGLSAGDRIEAQGYTWRSWGENIAAGYKTFSTALDGWLDSPGHCSNIMSQKFTEIGMDFVTDTRSDYEIYWTQVFARPAPATE
ncbi:MAG: CAP domain-containing protein [Pseudomonadota bacterium]|nr:CAP domain-containing protein [Pseudomonadota bacterium]